MHRKVSLSEKLPTIDESTKSFVFPSFHKLHACIHHISSLQRCIYLLYLQKFGHVIVLTEAIMLGKSAFRCTELVFEPLTISSSKTPKLYTSDLTENTPFKAYSGDM